MAAVVVIVLGIGLRFAFLDADPHYYGWTGYIIDEGRWTDQARERALSGDGLGPPWSLHVLVAPLFQLTSYVVFAMNGVSVVSSRLLAAVSGSLMVIVFAVAFRSATTPEAFVLALVPLALQVDLVTLSRLAVPEMTLIALQLIVYLAISSGHATWRRRFSAGLVSFVAIGMKITVVPTVAIFFLLLLFRPLRLCGHTKRYWAGFLSFTAGVVGPCVMLALVVLACCSDLTPDSVRVHLGHAELGAKLWALHTMLSLSPIDRAMNFPFDDPLASELNVWALACSYAFVGWRAARSHTIDPGARRHFLAAAVWAALYLGIMQASYYFPNRYKVHILLPMCITVVIGIGLLQRAGISNAERAFAEARGVRRLVDLALLGLPTATFVAPWVAAALPVFGVEPFRLRHKVVALAVSFAAVSLVVEWHRRRQRRLAFFLLFPLVAALTWAAAQRTGLLDAAFWPTPEAPHPSLTWLALLLAVILSAAIVAQGRWVAVSLPAGVALSATAYALLALVQLAPGYLSPHYSIRDTSRQLGVLLAGFSGTVASYYGDGLFRENTLRYRTVVGHRWLSDTPDKPDVVLIVFKYKFADPNGILAREYCQIGEYPLYVSPAFYRANPEESPTSSLGETARVYRRRPSPHCLDQRRP